MKLTFLFYLRESELVGIYSSSYWALQQEDEESSTYIKA